MPVVTLYSLSTCGVCRKVKQFLEDNKIPYDLIQVDTLDSGEQWLMTKELKKHNPQATFPTLVIEEVIRGYDEEALKSRLLGKAAERAQGKGA